MLNHLALHSESENFFVATVVAVQNKKGQCSRLVVFVQREIKQHLMISSVGIRPCCGKHHLDQVVLGINPLGRLTEQFRDISQVVARGPDRSEL